uniref:hypothetical protein n=1 Tax=Algoriphagus sp. TaxID=1872435 RepID=UPI0040488A95
MKNFWIVGLVLVALGCSSSKGVPKGEASRYSDYDENISSSLPDFPDFKQALDSLNTAPTSSSQEVDAALSEQVQKNFDKAKLAPYFSGFTVLVYSGVDRNAAFKVLEELTLLFPDSNPEMQYQQPRYLIKVGRFGYKIEAQPVFNALKKQFPTTRIIQDRFLRKEYVLPSSTDIDATGQN